MAHYHLLSNTNIDFQDDMPYNTAEKVNSSSVPKSIYYGLYV